MNESENLMPKRKVLGTSEFSEWAKVLRREFLRDPQGRSGWPREKPLNRLKDRLYGYFCQLRKEGRIGELAVYITEHHSAWKGPFPGDAAWVVRLIETADTDMLSRNLRKKVVIDLTLADRHRIRPEMFLAFLFEAGSEARRSRALRLNERLPWVDRYQAEPAVKRLAEASV